MATFAAGTFGNLCALTQGRSEKSLQTSVARLPEGASQSATYKGLPIVLASNAAAAASVGVLTGPAGAAPFIGWANQDFTGTTGTMVEIFKPSPDELFYMQTFSGTSVTATAASQIGVAYQLRYISTTTGVALDVGATTNPLVEVVGFLTGATQWGDMTVGDTGAIAIVKFIPSFGAVTNTAGPVII